MNIAFSTGYLEGYWGRWPFEGKMVGGSERLVVELACALARAGHAVTVRLPYATPMVSFRNVRWVGHDSQSERYDLLFCVDDFSRRDTSARTVLVACRSDPPKHKDFDQRIYLSRHHAQLMGDPDAPYIGGGVNLEDYKVSIPRVHRRVIYTSSPDRGGHHAQIIGREFDYVATYRGGGELSRADFVATQKSAMVQIHPCDPRRPSEFFCMSILEAMAAGTPCVISDADALPELWSEAAVVLPRPIDYAQWTQTVEDLIDDTEFWIQTAARGRNLAAKYGWDDVAKRYMEASL